MPPSPDDIREHRENVQKIAKLVHRPDLDGPAGRMYEITVTNDDALPWILYDAWVEFAPTYKWVEIKQPNKC